MMRAIVIKNTIIAIAIFLCLSACGGGGGGGGGGGSSGLSGNGGGVVSSVAYSTSSIADNKLNITGIVAVGAAVSNVPVTASCKNSTWTSNPTGKGGEFDFSIQDKAPCILSVKLEGNATLNSIYSNGGVSNITPVSDLIFKMAKGDPSSFDRVSTEMLVTLPKLGIELFDDPTTTKFVANGKGIDKALDQYAQIANSTNLSSGGSIDKLVELNREWSERCVGRLGANCTPIQVGITQLPKGISDSDKDRFDKYFEWSNLVTGSAQLPGIALLVATEGFNTFLHDPVKEGMDATEKAFADMANKQIGYDKVNGFYLKDTANFADASLGVINTVSTAAVGALGAVNIDIADFGEKTFEVFCVSTVKLQAKNSLIDAETLDGDIEICEFVSKLGGLTTDIRNIRKTASDASQIKQRIQGALKNFDESSYLSSTKVFKRARTQRRTIERLNAKGMDRLIKGVFSLLDASKVSVDVFGTLRDSMIRLGYPPESIAELLDYAGSVPPLNSPPVVHSIVESISPLEILKMTPKIIKVTGKNLSVSAHLNIPDVACEDSFAISSAGFSQLCNGLSSGKKIASVVDEHGEILYFTILEVADTSDSNKTPVVSGFTINNTTSTTVTGSFTITDADNDKVKNLRVHIGKVDGGSDCFIDVGGVYGTEQVAGAKSFTGTCATPLTAAGTYYGKVEAADVKGTSAPVVKTTFTYTPGSNKAPVVSGFTINNTTSTTVTGSFTITDADNDKVKNLRVHIGKVDGGSDCLIDVGGVYGTEQVAGAKSFTGTCAAPLTVAGTYYGKVEAADVKGTSAAVVKTTFTYTPSSNKAPVFSGFTINNTTSTTVTGSFTITDADNDKVKNLRVHIGKVDGGSDCLIDVGGVYGTEQVAGAKSFTGTCATPLTVAGTYYGKVEAADVKGTSAAVVKTTFTYTPSSNKAPVVSGFTINNTTSTTVTGSFTITDADNDKVKNLRVHIGKVDGGSDCLIDVGGVYGTEQVAGAKSFTGTCATPLTIAGTYYGKVEAADVKGTSAAVVKTTFTYTPDSNKVPVVSGFSVANTTSPTVSGSFNVTDPNGVNIKYLRVHVAKTQGGSECQIDVGTYGSLQTGGNKNFSGNCASLLTATGTYYAKVEAADAIGKQAVVINTSFTYTKIISLPVVSSLSVANTSTATVSGSFNVTDPNGVNIKYLRVHVAKTQGGSECQIDVGTYGSLQAGGNKNFSGNCAALLTASGTYYAKVEATDASGNQANVVNSPFQYTSVFSVSSFSPATLKKGVQTTITITGVSVPSSAILTVENANCGFPYGHTSTSFKQDCNAQLTGTKMLTVKDRSGGNIVYTNSFSVTN